MKLNDITMPENPAHDPSDERDPIDMTPDERRAWGIRHGFSGKFLEHLVRFGGFEEIDLNDDEIAASDRALDSLKDHPAFKPLRRRPPTAPSE